MAGYRLLTFDGVDLPEYNPEHDWSPAPVLSTMQRGIGGTFDRYGSDRRLPDLHEIAYTGIYVGEGSFVVGHDGAYNVDHEGNFWIGGDAEQELRAQAEALLAKVGVRGNLVRSRHDDAVEQWKQARLLSVEWRTEHEERTVLAKVTPRLQVLQPAWKDDAETSNNISLATLESGAVLHNGGMIPIHDATIAVLFATALTTITITGDNGTDLTWAGSLGAGERIDIDCGAQTVVHSVDGDAYSGLTLNAGHTAEGWLPLALGANTLQVTTDATCSVVINYYNQWL